LQFERRNLEHRLACLARLVRLEPVVDQQLSSSLEEEDSVEHIELHVHALCSYIAQHLQNLAEVALKLNLTTVLLR